MQQQFPNPDSKEKLRTVSQHCSLPEFDVQSSRMGLNMEKARGRHWGGAFSSEVGWTPAGNT